MPKNIKPFTKINKLPNALYAGPIVLGAKNSPFTFPLVNKTIYNEPVINPCTIKHQKKLIPNAFTPLAGIVYTPQQIRKAYGVDQLTLDGSGITVAVIIAFSYRNLQRDFNVFCTQFNLPLITLDIRRMANNIRTNSGWALEECLDVQMVHSIAPRAKIMVVEARSNSFTDLNAAVSYANNNGANIISMSYGANEFSSQNIYASVYNNNRKCYVASAGDTAATVEVPSCFANVLSIGGTTLNLDACGNRISESTWNNGGCGISRYIAKPTYQNDVSGITTNFRNCCDISLVANPNTGVYVYYAGSWYSLGGTSVSAPCMSGILALANQNRISNGKILLTTIANAPNNIMNYLYQTIYKNNSSYINNFNDINVGTDGIFVAKTGYDNPTGLGSPKVNIMIPSLLNI